MKLGLKVSLQKYSLSDLALVKPAAAEVWFDISRSHSYRQLFDALKTYHTDVGLHFWGAIPDGTMANIAYPDKRLNHQSMKLIKMTIDIAKDNGFEYVNIHPSQRALVRVDFQAQQYPYVSKPADLNDCINRFLMHAKKLSVYAKNRGVVLTVETVSKRSPQSDWYNPSSRLTPINVYDLPVDAIQKAADVGIAVANDFVHTATHANSVHPQAIWNYVLRKTIQLSSATKLIHIGFLVPPYNGVDSHDSFDNPAFLTAQAIPNRNQLKELLAIFKNRHDVWVIPEPRADHATNYLLAQNLLSEL